jgi:hypothetical protein
MGPDQLQTAGNGAGINADTQERFYILQFIIERQQQQIENLQETVSGLQLENLQYQFSEFQEANSHDITLYNDLEQRIVEQDREISDVYEQQLLQRASELDTFGDQNRLFSPSRKLIDTNYDIHEANIKVDMDAVSYLEGRNPHRIAQVTRGFEKRYGILITDYYEFEFCDAPDAVINALNKRSDLEHLPRYRKFVDEERKLQAIAICESVIRQWKAFNTPTVDSSGFSIAASERQIERVNDIIEIIDSGIRGSSSDDTEFSDGSSIF